MELSDPARPYHIGPSYLAGSMEVHISHWHRCRRVCPCAPSVKDRRRRPERVCEERFDFRLLYSENSLPARRDGQNIGVLSEADGGRPWAPRKLEKVIQSDP